MKKITAYIMPVCILLWVTFVNSFPQGYTFSGGDFSQALNISQIFSNFFYVWGNRICVFGEGGFFPWYNSVSFYFIFYRLPEFFGLNNTNILSYILFLFLLLSYLSFLFSIKLLFKNNNKAINALFSLCYALNLTTLYFYTFIWGFSHQIIIYIFIPVLTALFIKFIETCELNYMLGFLLFLFLSIPAYGNPAFFVALCFFLSLIFLGLILVRHIKFDLRFLKAVLILVLLALGVLSCWLLPLLVFVKSGFKSITVGAFALKSWLDMQSTDILSIFLNVPSRKEYFPFKYDNGFSIMLSFLPILGIGLALMIKTKKARYNFYKVIFAFIYVLFVFLLKKTYPPFSQLSLWIFNIPFFTVLRSYEKLAVFMPYIILVMLYVLALDVCTKKNMRLLAFSVFLLFIIPAPFFKGGVLQKYSVAFSEKDNYKNADYSYLVKIPDEYKGLSKIAEEDLTDSKVLSLPYSVINSVGWVNYPKWKLVGVDPVQNFHGKPTVQANSFNSNLSGWNYGLSWNEIDTRSSGWIIPLSGLLNAKYIIYHKDVATTFLNKTTEKIKYLKKQGLVRLLLDNEMYSFYEVSSIYFRPHIYTVSNAKIVFGKLDLLGSGIGLNNFSKNMLFLPAEDLKENNPEYFSEKIPYVFSSQAAENISVRFMDEQKSLKNTAGAMLNDNPEYFVLDEARGSFVVN